MSHESIIHNTNIYISNVCSAGRVARVGGNESIMHYCPLCHPAYVVIRTG